MGTEEQLVEGQRTLRFIHIVDIPAPSSIEVIRYIQEQHNLADQNIRRYRGYFEGPTMPIKQERFSDSEEDSVGESSVFNSNPEESFPSNTVSDSKGNN